MAMRIKNSLFIIQVSKTQIYKFKSDQKNFAANGRIESDIKLYYCDSGAAAFNVLIFCTLHGAGGYQVLPYHVPQDTVALAVQDAQMPELYHHVQCQ